MSTLDLPGMNFDDALAAWICDRVSKRVDPTDITDQQIVHEDYYSNGDTDWPEQNYVSFRYIWSPEKWERIDIPRSTSELLYDLLRIGLMTTLVEPPAGDER